MFHRNISYHLDTTLRRMWEGRTNSITPLELTNQFREVYPQFIRGQQHDVADLLERIIEESSPISELVKVSFSIFYRGVYSRAAHRVIIFLRYFWRGVILMYLGTLNMKIKTNKKSKIF